MKSSRPRAPVVANHTANETLPLPDPASLLECSNGFLCWIENNLFLARLVGTLIVLIGAWLLMKVGERAMAKSVRRIARLQGKDDYQTTAMVGRTRPMVLVINIIVFTVTVLSLLALWGLQTAFAGLLAGAGFAGIVIGLAAGDTIGDIVAGFLIFYNHPFDIGDWVEIDGMEGIVTDVALGATTMMSFDNEKITLPNRMVEGNRVKNFSHARKLRRRLLVGVEYGSHLGKAMETMVKLANAHPQVLPDPEPSAVAKGFGSSSVDLELRFYVEPIRSSAIKVYTDLVHQIHDTFRREGLNIAFPHMQIVQSSAWKLENES